MHIYTYVKCKGGGGVVSLPFLIENNHVIPCNRNVCKQCSTLTMKFDSKSTRKFCNTPVHKGLWLVSCNNKIIYVISSKISLKNKNMFEKLIEFQTEAQPTELPTLLSPEV